MNIRAVLCSIPLLTVTAFTLTRPVPSSQPILLHSTPVDPFLRGLGQRASRHFQSGEFRKAAALYGQCAAHARSLRNERAAIQCLNSLGACQFAMCQYSSALATFLGSLDAAKQTGDAELASYILSNIATVYAQLGDSDSAYYAASAALAFSGKTGSAGQRAKLLIRCGSLMLTRPGHEDEGDRLLRSGIALAVRQNDYATQAQGWAYLGGAYLSQRRFAEALRAMERDLSLRRRFKLPDLHLSYRNLGVLSLAQGDTKAASKYLDLAVAGARNSSSLVPVWNIYFRRGQLRLTEKRWDESLSDLRSAIRLARVWRSDALPSDASRVQLEVGLNEIYCAFIEAAVGFGATAQGGALAQEAFEIAEENRAASLRQLIASQRGKGMMPEYGELLAQLRRAEIAALRTGAPSPQLERLRNQIHVLENREGVATAVSRTGLADSAGLLTTVQRALRPDQAYVSFHLGDRASCAWAVTKQRFLMHALPARAAILPQVQKFTEAIRAGSPGANELGAALYNRLLRPLAPALKGSSRLLLSLDRDLFELPFPALIASTSNSRPFFLIEEKSVQLTPGAYATFGRASGLQGRFVAIGDPVYNSADPRFSIARKPASPGLQLARLAGSGREIRDCARAWNSSTVMLDGPAATRANIRQALTSGAAICHFATHVLQRSGGPRGGMIALSILPNGDADLLTEAEVAAWRPLDVGLVVLSGCSSGTAGVLPGAGLMGLTRAWLAAGAGAVVASLWPTPDDSGQIFLRFYRHMRDSGSTGRMPSQALRLAQLDMLHSGTWRSEPRYWAAYFAVGREQI